MSGSSRVMTVFTVLTAAIGCAAAVVVIPEVRCAMGLEEGKVLDGGRCRSASVQADAVLSLGFLPLPVPGSAPGSGTLADRADEETIKRIRREYNHIEESRERLHTRRQEIEGSDTESAYANVWSEDGAIRLIRTRFHRDGYRKALLFYYTRGELIFVHQVVKRIGPRGEETELDQQQFYFDRGRLIR